MDETIYIGNTEPDTVRRLNELSRVELAPGTRVGRYLLIKQLGRGGMGVVYSAYDPELGRQVAIKLLRVDGSRRGRNHMRMRREAQALAQLSHPNVVAIHDVGNVVRDVGHSFFIAMELVEGKSLIDWLKEGEKKPVAEVVRVFLEAGRGLAAAHEAGIVHRDFKPANVVISADGRVKVLDFGLARGMLEPPTSLSQTLDEELECTPISLESSGRGELLLHSLTMAGSVTGTPAYVSPEQYLGEAADARSDQYSFCVALYQALHGQLPYTGDDLESLRSKIVAGELPPLSSLGRVPPWLHAVVLRGMSVDSDARYPSMTALLQALENDPAHRRRQWLLAGSAAAAMMLLPLLPFLVGDSLFAGSDTVCPAPSERVSEVWNSNIAGAIDEAFSATGVIDAGDLSQRVHDYLGQYIGEWQRAYMDACEATHVHHVQSATLLDKRMLCLSRRLNAMDALTTVLIDESNAHSISQAPAAVLLLPPIAECSDEELLLRVETMPRDDKDAARVDEYERQIDRILALGDGDHMAKALALAEELIPKIRLLECASLLARALYVYGRLQSWLGQYAEAEVTLTEAVIAAAEAEDDQLVAKGQLLLVDTIGAKQRDLRRAGLLLKLAEAAVLRAGDGDDLRSTWLLQACAVAGHQQRHRRALEFCRGSMELASRQYGAASVAAGTSGFNLGLRYMELGQYRNALDEMDHAVDLLTHRLGPRSRQVLMARINRLKVLAEWGRWRTLAREYDEVTELTARTLGPEHAFVEAMLVFTGDFALRQGRAEQAIQLFERALALDIAGTYRRQRIHTRMARALANTGAHEAADVRLERAAALSDGPDAEQLYVHGLLSARRGQWAQATAALSETLAMLEHTAGHSSASLVRVLVDLARVRWSSAAARKSAEGRAESGPAASAIVEAGVLLERAQRIVDLHPHPTWPDGMALQAAYAEFHVETGRSAEARQRIESLMGPAGILHEIGSAFDHAAADSAFAGDIAMALEFDSGIDKRDLAALLWAGARALWDVHSERRHALRWARLSLAHYRRLGAGYQREMGQITAWLQARE